MKLVVAGNGPVGHHLVTRLRDRDPDGAWEVTVLAEETRPAYDRTRLSEYFHGSTMTDLTLEPVPGTTLRLGRPAEEIDRERRMVITRDGEYRYDALVLATGAYPYVPPIPGAGLGGCFTYRTADDLTDLEAYALGRQHALVLGGGLLGLEAANALRLLGLRTHLVEQAPHLLTGHLDAGGAQVLRGQVEGLGIHVHTGRRVTRLTADATGAVRQAVLADGGVLGCDLVVFACGVRPRDDLAREAGLALGGRGGIAVDDACRSSDEAIYAIGECAELDGQRYGLLPPGLAMAEVVVDRLLGGNARFAGADTSVRLRLAGVEAASFGQLTGGLDVTFADPAG
ncbi:MAG TPA: FAD-dependent oxidoreductase, partial [Rugosimonospora sp.]|nr:FAD-dependent oxidoreductase [Rugosimonospora sp.]